MTHEDIQDLLAPYALDAASPEEQATVEAHLPGCVGCRGVLAKLRCAALALPAVVEPLAPPPHLKSRVMVRIRGPRLSRGFALAAGFLLAVGVGSTWFLSRSPLRLAASPGILLVDGRPVEAGRRVRLGRRLETAGDAPADFALDSRVAFRLNPGSAATVVRAGGGYRIDLAEGAVLSDVRSGAAFAVRTPLVTAADLGTVFYVQIDGPDHASVCICRGRFKLDGAGYSAERAGEHHNPTGLRIADGKLSEDSPSALAHSDAAIEDLEKILR